MKRMILVFLTACSAVVASAQIQFGIKAGINFADLSISQSTPGSSFSSKTDFNAGILASIPLSGNLYLQPEIMYSGQGGSTSDSFIVAGKLNYDYLNIPVLIKYQLSSGLFAETGPQVGFLLSANFKAGSQSLDEKSNSQTTDFSWAFGLGYKIPDAGLGIDLRYNLGLTNIAKDSGSADETVKNSVFQIDLFYVLKGL
jgi:hypothetical protein